MKRTEQLNVRTTKAERVMLEAEADCGAGDSPAFSGRESPRDASIATGTSTGKSSSMRTLAPFSACSPITSSSIMQDSSG
jgi:hypothetical protein